MSQIKITHRDHTISIDGTEAFIERVLDRWLTRVSPALAADRLAAALLGATERAAASIADDDSAGRRPSDGSGDNSSNGSTGTDHNSNEAPAAATDDFDYKVWRELMMRDVPVNFSTLRMALCLPCAPTSDAMLHRALDKIVKSGSASRLGTGRGTRYRAVVRHYPPQAQEEAR